MTAAESEITFDEGDAANAPVEGDTTVTGNLGNANGPLAGRDVTLTYAATGRRLAASLRSRSSRPA